MSKSQADIKSNLLNVKKSLFKEECTPNDQQADKQKLNKEIQQAETAFNKRYEVLKKLSTLTKK